MTELEWNDPDALDRQLARPERDERRRVRDILSAALDLVQGEGFGSFSMQRLAAASGYSRTALYSYFPCKEEVLATLAVESYRRRVHLYLMLPSFQARTRERMVAMGEVSAIFYPDLFNLELLAYARSFRARISEDRQRQLHELEIEGYRIGAGIVRDAVRCGDLALPDGMSPEFFVFGPSMLLNGVFGAVGTVGVVEDLGVDDLVASMRYFGRCLLDGCGWRPLSDEWDYRQTMARVYSELFPPVLVDRVKRM